MSEETIQMIVMAVFLLGSLLITAWAEKWEELEE